MNIYTIYKATNKINGKVYIGFDSNWPNRKKSHYYMHRSKNCPNYYFYKALKKHGWNIFEWAIVYQSLDFDHCLNKMENFFIIENHSYVGFANSNGYNNTLGGQGTLGKTQPEHVKKAVSIASTIRNKNSKWYNNGTENRFTSAILSNEWVIGRLNQKPVNTGKKYYNNGTENRLCIEHPGEGWNLGMKPLSIEQSKIKSDNCRKANIGRKHSQDTKNAQSFRQIGTGKAIMTPYGIFKTNKLAAEYYDVAPSTISSWVRKNPTNFYYIRKNNDKNE